MNEKEEILPLFRDDVITNVKNVKNQQKQKSPITLMNKCNKVLD